MDNDDYMRIDELEKELAVCAKKFPEVYEHIDLSTVNLVCKAPRSETTVKFTCFLHGPAEILVSDMSRGIGCPKCGKQSDGKSAEVTLYEHMKRGDFGYNPDDDDSTATRLQDFCRLPFVCTVKDHSRSDGVNINNYSQGFGCPICSSRRMLPQKRTLESLNQEVRILIGPHITLLDRESNRTDCYGIFHCGIHDRYFLQNISNAIDDKSCACRECHPLKLESRKCQKWLEQIEKKEGISIQREGYPFKFCIPGTKFSVDGYHAPTNRVFEFCEERQCGKENLQNWNYQKALLRQEVIKNLGYNVVAMWERNSDICINHPLESKTEDDEDKIAYETLVSYKPNRQRSSIADFYEAQTDSI